VRHCWVAGAADDLGVKRPGLLVEWRRTDAGWQGRVVYAAELRVGEWSLVEEWLPSTLLSPALTTGDERTADLRRTRSRASGSRRLAASKPSGRSGTSPSAP
jgi:hypothetical protein